MQTDNNQGIECESQNIASPITVALDQNSSSSSSCNQSIGNESCSNCCSNSNNAVSDDIGSCGPLKLEEQQYAPLDLRPQQPAGRATWPDSDVYFADGVQDLSTRGKTYGHSAGHDNTAQDLTGRKEDLRVREAEDLSSKIGDEGDCRGAAAYKKCLIKRYCSKCNFSLI